MHNMGARIAIVGGGFGGLFTALELAGAGEVTLIEGREHFTFTPLLYEYLSGEVEAWHIAPRYRELLDDRVRFVQGEVESINFADREIAVAGRARRFGYDVLILSPGSTNNFFNIEGARKYALPFRIISDADKVRWRMKDALDSIAPNVAPQDATQAATFAVVGGGASGVEVATKMADMLNEAFVRRGLPGTGRVLVLEMGNRIVPGMGEDLRAYVTQVLREARVEIHTETRVTRVGEHGLTIEHNGRRDDINAAGIVWTAGVRVAPLIENIELTKDARGRIRVLDTLQSVDHAEVFVLGDVAHCESVEARMVGTAQLAFQQSSLVAANVRALLTGADLTTRHFTEMGEAVSLGTHSAAVATAGQIVHGALARQARFALYTSRLPTWHHRLRVSASWFVEGTRPQPL